MTSPMRALAAAAILALSAACSDPPPESADPRAPRDLTGAEIIEPAWEDLDRAPPWRLPDEPGFVLGQAEGDDAYLLHRVGQVLRLDDGRIALANAGVELRMYQADGTHAWSLGGRGEGPGEFRGIAGIVFERDTLFVFDSQLARISFVDTTGTYLGGLPPLAEVAWAVGIDPRLVAALPDGRFVFKGGFPAPRLEGVQVHWQTVADIAMTRDGARADTLVVAGMEWVTGNRHFLAPPFGRHVNSAVGAGYLLTTHSGWYELELRNLGTGAIERLIRPQRAVEPLHAREFATALEEHFEAALRTQARDDIGLAEQALTPLRSAAPGYRTKPAWVGLHVGDDGAVWAREFAPLGDTLQRFTVFDLGGELLGRAELPVAVRIWQVARDHLVAVARDEWEVERVVVYPVRFRAAPLEATGPDPR